jgi:hypothetical protein
MQCLSFHHPATQLQTYTEYEYIELLPTKFQLAELMTELMSVVQYDYTTLKIFTDAIEVPETCETSSNALAITSAVFLPHNSSSIAFAIANAGCSPRESCMEYEKWNTLLPVTTFLPIGSKNYSKHTSAGLDTVGDIDIMEILAQAFRITYIRRPLHVSCMGDEIISPNGPEVVQLTPAEEMVLMDRLTFMKETNEEFEQHMPDEYKALWAKMKHTSSFKPFKNKTNILETNILETKLFETKPFKNKTNILETNILETKLFETKPFKNKLFETKPFKNKLFETKPFKPTTKRPRLQYLLSPSRTPAFLEI